MNEMQQVIVKELVGSLEIDKDYILNYMIERFPTLIKSLEKYLGTTKPELRSYVGDGNTVSSKVIADCVLGVNSIDVELTRLSLRVFREVKLKELIQ